MKLTNFQQYIKSEEIEADLFTAFAKSFMQELKDNYNDDYQLLMSDIEGSLSMQNFIEWSYEFNDTGYRLEMDRVITRLVNELIVTTLEEIEDIETTNAQDAEDARGDHLYELAKQERIDNGIH